MNSQKSFAIPRLTAELMTPQSLIQDGRNMAALEDAEVYESINIKHAAELAEHQSFIQTLKGVGTVTFQKYKRIERELIDLGFNEAAHLRALAHGWVDLYWAIGLSAMNAALALLVLLALGPTLLTIPLALVVLVTALPVEEFFQAHEEKADFREGMFLTASVLALGATLWFGSVRGLFLEALTPADIGPVTHALQGSARIFRFTFGILACISEFVAGYKLYRARTALMSATARGVRERDKHSLQLSALHASMETAKVAPEIRQRYRIIGARQYLASKSGSEKRFAANHLRRAATGALLALLVMALILLLASSTFAAIPGGRTIVAIVDLTKSVGDTKFSSNLQAVPSLISKLDPGDRLVVTGITDSFATTESLLDQTMPARLGYMGFELQAARESLLTEWQRISRVLQQRHSYIHTDLTGTLTFLSYVAGIPESKRLYIFIFSDLRQSTSELDIEHTAAISATAAMTKFKRHNTIPNFQGAKIYLLGVDVTGKSALYFSGLKGFWLQFQRSRS